MPYRSAAETIYSYIDEQGTPVLTDNYNRIPERYRAKVKTTEQVCQSAGSDCSVGDHPQDGHELGQEYDCNNRRLCSEDFRVFARSVEDLDAAGLVGLICVIAMYMSRNQAIKFLSLWTLIIAGIVTPVLLYTAQGGASDVMKAKATEAAKKQQDRLQQVP